MPEMMTSEKKVALVTGGSRGIGASCVKKLAEKGFSLAIHYRSREEEAAQVLKEIGGNGHVYQADLADPEACQGLIQKVIQDMGPIHTLVNNAGVSLDQILPFAKPEDFDQLIQVNLRPVFLLSKFVSKPMMKQKKGRIINLSSVVGFCGNKGQSLYGATKGAIAAFTKSIALDLAPFNILCNTVAPGFVDTEMTSQLPEKVREMSVARIPLGRFGYPEEVASVVSFLASEEASYITGSTIHINGGLYSV